MPNLNQTRSTCNQEINQAWTDIQAFQADYFNLNGRYWQGLWTHTQPPAHTSSAWGSAVPDNLAERPTDVPESWLDKYAALQGRVLAARYRSDVYQGPSGWGYVLTAEFRHAGTLYQRSLNQGGEAHRARDWEIFDPGE